jgi:hypothetical protein
MATGSLEAVAAGVAEALRRDPPGGVPVVSVLDAGYRAVPMPCVTVDAPVIEDIETGLRAYRESVTAPVRVVPASASDAAGLIRLTDATIYALRAAGFKVANVRPGTMDTAGPNPVPVYTVTLQIDTVTER